jgi:uncharacterized membrane protein YfcA
VEPAARRTRTMVGAALIGLVIGFMGGMLGIGGGQIGSRIMAEKLRGRTVRIIFGCVLIALAATLGWSIHDWS